MLLRLFVLLTVVPLAELAVLLWLSRISGSLLLPVGLVLVTAVVGAALAKHEGLRVIRHLRADLEQGRLPGDPLLDGVLVLLAGAFLVTPGLITDAAGFLLLAPPTRTAVRRRLKRWVIRRLATTAGLRMESSWNAGIDDRWPPGSPPRQGRP
jgi:UPF0716 protein FxsA